MGSGYSVPLGGGVTGRHGHILVADDPTKPQDIQLGGDSARDALEKVREKWDNVFSSRSADPATFCRIVIAQRLHMEDLSGHCIKRGAVHLRLPMLFEPHEAYVSQWGSDWRTEPNQLLAPKRFPDHVVAMRRQITDARDWAAQYQQRPSPEDGAVFMREWFRHFYRELPKNLQLTLSIDSSLKDSKKADYTVLQVWGKQSATAYYLVDQVRARMGFSDQVLATMNMRSKWPALRTTLIEAKANGVAIINVLRARIPGVVPVEPLDGKESRARASTWLWQSGNVHLPHPDIAPWITEYIEEHVVFPVGGYDDCVDCTSQYLGWASARDRNSLFAKAMLNARSGYSFR
jgi:predicted phage terminase large subunit-like protein